MDMEQLGFYLYMDECDRAEIEAQQKEQIEVNDEIISHLEREQTTHNEGEKLYRINP